MNLKIEYLYPAARSLVILHEQSLRKYFDTWKKAKSMSVKLPETDDPNYKSFNALLRHVLSWSREYMVWICEKLDLPDPVIKSSPDIEVIDSKAPDYLEHLYERWRLPLVKVPEEKFSKPTYVSHWNVNYCIDAMLEHAVMPPIRHRFQLLELLDKHSLFYQGF